MVRRRPETKKKQLDGPLLPEGPSTAVLREVFDQAPIAIALVDPGGRPVLVNRALCDMLGYTADELCRMHFTEFTHPEDVQADRKLFQELLRGRRGHCTLRKRYVRKDGRVVTALVSVGLVRDERGRPRLIVGMAQDITEQVAAEDRTREYLERLEVLHRIVRAANQRLDRENTVRVAIRDLERVLPETALVIFSYDVVADAMVLEGSNEAARPMTAALGMDDGVSVEAGRFQWLDDLKPGRPRRVDDLADEGDPYLRRLIEAGLRSVLLVPVSSEGELLGVLCAGRPTPRAFTDADVAFLTDLADHLAVTFRNARLFAELERAYKELQQAQAVLVQQEQLHALGRMASGIAHDINNALVPIVGYAELLERHGDEQVRERARRLREAAEDITRIVERLRVFYRPRALEESLEAVDLNEAVQRVAELTRPRWYDEVHREGVTIEFDTDLTPDLPPIAAVGAEVREALTNLVFNAVDAILAKRTPRGRIVVRTRRQDDWAIVEVTDTGVGMDEETRRRALEPFFTTKGERGCGLGLAMVYGIMQRHDGGIELDSRLGQGTTARLIFPVRTVERRALPEMPEVPTASARILLIDDDPRVQQSVSAMLQDMGHRVTVAGGGAIGLALFEEALRRGEAYDLVLTDLGMPHLTGAEVARRVKALSPATPVIVLTGWGRESKPPYADAALGKPVTWRELKAVLARFLFHET